METTTTKTEKPGKVTWFFRVYGDPKGQPRPRAFAMGGKARMYDPGTAEGWKGQIAMAARPVMPATPIATPVLIQARFIMARPKSHFGTGKNAAVLKPSAPVWYGKKPDNDNFEKALWDALSEIGFWKDDALVAKNMTEVKYANPGQRTGVQVWISLLEDSDAK